MSSAEIQGPDTGPEPGSREPSGGRWTSRRTAALVAAPACATVLVVAGVRLSAELGRGPTAAERAAAMAAEVSGRYRTWPAGRIFPAELPYTLGQSSPETARRVGIGTDTRCETAADDTLVRSLAARGCRAVLRATYLDQAQGLAVTVGVAVFPDERRAREAVDWFPGGTPRPGLRALPFAGSVAARFGDAARQTSAAAQRGPYVVAATVGYADGRPTLRGPQADLSELAPQLVRGVLRPLTTPAKVRCGDREWRC
ncbi:hypothetical protein [Actinomadura formosensis]|uniref:hypothetical protein n=1 Tax=Actinomadura formosensis TaxID=60706 RepID=UPI000836F73B|nr:hypothetical protein [Actinomadura formosensis]